MLHYQLRLFIAGDSAASRNACRNLEDFRRRRPDISCDVQLVDVTADPQSAEQFKVIATPMLLREQPSPVRRIIGDLSDLITLLEALDIESTPSHTSQENGCHV